MEIYRFAFIILLSSLLVSCGEKKQETGNADKAAEKKKKNKNKKKTRSTCYVTICRRQTAFCGKPLLG